ncbi:GNAT family N-acetyltransferase [Cesiribacter andamanensis]|uniref:Putative acetyltransferase, GNAT superfamily n=1 Tax=Cesiribacter andamanensis AMV16 TaxID=1279009 RepID=M7N3J3_9BACT|nr:GNAT family N-acetyltransferase [Cesiribacter andamanensis]EMR01862.1 putative acetyltransferase, GNAT superfamily [Cesiribacter andamanensis AMV16]
MIRYQLARTRQELQQVLALQQQNLPSVLPDDALASQGFVTVAHPLPLLQQMNAAAPAILAKEGQQLAGYCLAMTRAFRNDIPVLIPMFEVIDGLQLQGRALKEVNYLVCGQICVAEGYRGQGIFDGLYQQLRQHYAQQYPLLLTEIAARNPRSLRAHQRLGFTTFHTYQAPDGEVWELVAWQW